MNFRKLTNQEIYHTLDKIREKYRELIDEFKKPKSLLDAFEERYISTLKSRMDLSVFLMAEIEAYEQLYNKEVEKRKNDERKKNEQKKKTEVSKSFADKIYEENKKKILKYPLLELYDGADDEVERLLGGVRKLITEFWPAITYIYKDDMKTSGKRRFGDYYHKLITMYDYKDEVPFAKHYIESLKRIPRDNRKVEHEHQYLMKETAFILNDLLENFKEVLENDFLPSPESKLNISDTIGTGWHLKHFKDLTVRESFEKVKNFIQSIIDDFRFKDIKRISRI